MDKEIYLFAANAVVWAGLAGYLAFLAMRQKALAARLARLEALGETD